MHDDRFARIRRMIGQPGLDRLHAACVAIIGLGAVGSYATEALARAGVGHLRLVDFDEVRASNINRQLYALQSTVGRPKIDIAAERVRDINPECQVQALRTFVHTDTLDEVLAGPPDLVLDAIDSFTPKVELLCALRGRGIPMISSMGAALRTDPTSIRVGPLDQVRHCPLASKVRKKLRRREVPLDFPCVYSIEPTAALPVTAIAAYAEADPLDRGRQRRTLASLPTLTGIFGLTAANVALRMLLKELWPAGGAS
jgi:tRNA A37 threonylcarbamoyladenosine dehydratase